MVSIRKIILIAITLSALLAPGVELFAADSNSADLIRERFREKQRATTTFQCKVTQILKLEDLDQDVTSSGHIYYKAPDKLLIKFDIPAVEYTLINGDRIFIKKEGEELIQRSRSPNDNPSEGIASMLSVFQNGGEDFEKSYESSLDKRDGGVLIVLRRKENVNRRLPETIRTELRPKTLEIKAIDVLLNEKNRISFKFESPKRNLELSDKIFEPSNP